MHWFACPKLTRALIYCAKDDSILANLRRSMTSKSQSKTKKEVRVQRVSAFAETYKKGATSSYMKYLSSEAKENRNIERYL